MTWGEDPGKSTPDFDTDSDDEPCIHGERFVTGMLAAVVLAVLSAVAYLVVKITMFFAVELILPNSGLVIAGAWRLAALLAGLYVLGWLVNDLPGLITEWLE